MVRSWLIAVGSLVAFLIGVYLVIKHALPLVLPFVIAFLLAELLEPLVSLLTRKARLPRGIAVLLTLLLIVVVISTGLTLAVGRLIAEIQAVSTNLPYLYAVALDASAQVAERFGSFNATLPASIQNALTSNLSAIQESLQRTLPSMVKSLSLLTGLPVLLTDTLMVAVGTFFLSRDRKEIAQTMLRLFPAPWRPKLQQIKAEVWSSAMGFAEAEALLIGLTMVESAIGLALIGTSYAVLMGMLIGLADMLPVVGPAIIFIPWLAYSFLFGSKLFAIKLAVVWLIGVGMRQVLEPKLVGDRLGLHPLTILLSIYLGFEFFGGLGFIVGPLLAILMKSVMHSGLLPGRGDDPPHVA